MSATLAVVVIVEKKHDDNRLPHTVPIREIWAAVYSSHMLSRPVDRRQSLRNYETITSISHYHDWTYGWFLLLFLSVCSVYVFSQCRSRGCETGSIPTFSFKNLVGGTRMRVSEAMSE